jgi:hypothetical protein
MESPNPRRSHPDRHNHSLPWRIFGWRPDTPRSSSLVCWNVRLRPISTGAYWLLRVNYCGLRRCVSHLRGRQTLRIDVALAARFRETAAVTTIRTQNENSDENQRTDDPTHDPADARTRTHVHIPPNKLAPHVGCQIVAKRFEPVVSVVNYGCEIRPLPDRAGRSVPEHYSPIARLISKVPDE